MADLRYIMDPESDEDLLGPTIPVRPARLSMSRTKESQSEDAALPIPMEQKTISPLLSPLRHAVGWRSDYFPRNIFEDEPQELELRERASLCQENGNVQEPDVTERPAATVVPQDSTIHIEDRQEEEKKAASYVVTIRYPKRMAKIIARLHALPLIRRETLKTVKQDEQLDREKSTGRDVKETRTLQDMQPVSAVAPTDSGYASVPAIESEPGTLKRGSQAVARESAEQDIWDTATEYSKASTTTFSRQQVYVRGLADELYSKISSPNADEETQRRVSAILPELLKAFALKIGHDSPTKMHGDVMAFVHKYRHQITAAFSDICFNQNKEDSERSILNSHGMPLDDIKSWLSTTSLGQAGYLDPDDIDSQEHDLTQECEMEAEDEEVPENWLLDYQEFVFSTDAYTWLLTRLRREFHLAPTEPNTIRAIRDHITSSMPSSRKISRQSSSQSYRAKFELDWDILEFFETQGYLNRPYEVFEGVITVTGSCRDAQAATCAHYMHQTWPLTGELIVQLIKRVLQSGVGHSHQCKLSDGTTLSAWASRPKFMVEAYGVAASIAETGEQLAWLGAALRTSPRRSGLVYCTPIITNSLQNGNSSQEPGLQPPLVEITFEIRFKIEKVRQPLISANGQCWHDIFRNPVVVKGYPIPQRIEWNTGLEIPLNVMAGLAGTQRLDRFNEKVYIKGFSTMLIPTRRNEDIICWHLIYNKDGCRISYLDDHVDQEQHIGHLDLESFRHVLGWCSEATFYAGSAQAQHPVTHSGLPKPHAGCTLANMIVYPGRMIMGGPTFNIGTKDTPAQVSRKHYIPRLKWISTKFVLLWDERDKRGWLINGTSALLHIVRASLMHDSEDKFSSAFIFKSEDLQESTKPFTADSAIDVLINPKNLGLKLYPEKDGYLHLESRIDHIYNVLEKLIDHQSDVTGDCDKSSRSTPRRYLEGWDFEDLATNRDPLYPRVATLGAGVGRGFGDIIRPADVNICEYWAELPKQKYYIASCVSDLECIVKEHGNYGKSAI
ncbi:hypothetical protein ONZ43_g5031 [Nemania bipapillata]|uniref:Uncharacterized protein n=1 Tax=Nemania bipapillata TaxID=110536 RepID=A0ACC2IFE1_9PEZI|nr:hypothetical protein ONZ43_g5031 [Nemania bipapillata]